MDRAENRLGSRVRGLLGIPGAQAAAGIKIVCRDLVTAQWRVILSRKLRYNLRYRVGYITCYVCPIRRGEEIERVKSFEASAVGTG